jgi:hypothetical protein
MSDDDMTTAALSMIEQTARILITCEEPLRILIAADQRHESIGAVLSPTFFRTTMWSKTYAANIAIAKATLAYIAALRAWDAVHSDERERKSTEAKHG